MVRQNLSLGFVWLPMRLSWLINCFISTNSNEQFCGSIRFEPSYYNYLCSDRKYFWDVSLEYRNASISESGLPRYIGSAGPITAATNSTTSLPYSTKPSSTLTLSTSGSTLKPSQSSTSLSSHITTGVIAGASVGGFVILCALGFGLGLLISWIQRHRQERQNARSAGGNARMYYPVEAGGWKTWGLKFILSFDIGKSVRCF